LSWAVWVECMNWPLATWTATGFVVGCTERREVELAKKWPVLPESRMMGGEGPGRAEGRVAARLAVPQLWVAPGVPLP
jgi:hypothetical protein